MLSTSRANLVASGDPGFTVLADSKIWRRWAGMVGDRFARSWIDWENDLEISSSAKAAD
jgi:hypothetical protein